ncbi:GNAT family N-acetyltransferase [Pseudonocardia sp. DSM 110487]|uniref:GNAT family N-acetyltransferase n=1 Tax=Pseudonocardia sp. DSM 110487 TaxID=2865833 RepID=UPI001C69A189|nr:GNAT family N-acetyltransferase [Pseudonocardia sp. DSM 110487]QYN32076.1 GNAT family N-acetyltransferase [Pseudonocardia sp. DSM 110487]
MLHHDAPPLLPPSIILRRATAADLPAVIEADGRAFGEHYSDERQDEIRALFDPDRHLLAEDAGEIVGIAGSYPFDVTLPGGAALPAAGVSWVSVAVTHRRRGILRALMAEQHRGFVADGLAVSLLTASEGAIYGRFGYGIATEHREVEINRRRAAFRSDVPDPGGVRQVGTPEMRRIAPEIHRRWAAQTPGALSRSDRWWDGLLADREWNRGGASALFHLAHPDGYASYRIDHATDTCRVVQMAAATDEAYIALWRTLLALDLVETVFARSLTVAEPLQFLLADPRQLRTVGLYDGMWARVLDVPAALSARRYAADVDVVLDVRDPFLDRGGRFRLRGGPDGAECVASGSGEPLVGIEMAALGSLLFGGAHAGSLARAGLLHADDPAVLRRLAAAFQGERTPQHGTEF